jgi:hypothetical protein
MVRAQTSRFTLEETAPIASLIGGWVDPRLSLCAVAQRETSPVYGK